MSFSKEWCIWYLTESGWVGGTYKCDTGTLYSKGGPKEYVAKYIYREEFSSPFDKNPIKRVECLEVVDSKRRDILIEQFGSCPNLI
jgi:hypothetical protein